ncbi:MAG: hypothetical protein ACR2QW_01125 [bacterium]
MPEKISILEDLRIIRVDSFGEVTASDLQASLTEVLAIHCERGINNVLVDSTHEASYPPNFPLFEFGSNLAADARHMRFAVATSPATRPAATLVKQVAANRGLILQLFDSVETAIESLLQPWNGSTDCS